MLSTRDEDRMSLLKSVPTTAWIVGATVAVAALTPVVGQVATSPAPATAVAVPATAAPVTPTQRTTPPATTRPPNSSSGSPIPQTPAPNTPAATGAVVGTAAATLGHIAADGHGLTLYMSVLDSNDPPHSVCRSIRCLTAWKPLYLPGPGVEPTAEGGVDPLLLGSLRRGDGTWQATLHGWPLYLYSGDREPGDVHGQGLKGTWFALTPAGKPIRVGDV
jgi:predicted lipoprotein with Yx(FWY)xxD motif